MAITVKKIAELAGVSRGTVDRALNNRPGVNSKTKNEILKIAKEHRYQPNIIGKALVNSNQNILVEIILNSIGNSFFNDIKKGILQAEQDYSSYGIKVHITELKGYNEDNMLCALKNLDSNVKNVILTPAASPLIESEISKLTKKGVNVITLSNDTEKSDRLSYVGCNYDKSGKIMGRLVGLLANGEGKICIVTGNLKHDGHRRRVKGILEVLDNYPNITVCDILENNDDDKLSYQKLKGLLKKNKNIDFVCITAGGISGSLKAIKESGRKIKACCFDETTASKDALKSGDILAIVCQQPYTQGYNAVKTVFDRNIANTDIESYQFTDLNICVDQSL